MDKILEDIRSFITYHVTEGYESEQEIIENATAYAEEHGWDDLRPEIPRMTALILAAHRKEQAGWTLSTDCDRLDQAFAKLDRLGIVARQDFSCCTPCGHKDIWDEIAKAEESQRIDGYVFFHFQCIEGAIESGQVLLAYGSTEDDETALDKVGNTIVRELRRTGLDAKWNGKSGSPISVDRLAWRRRANL